MIVSHKHRFVFVKTRKTGGSSIEHALSEFCGGGDVLTPLPPEVKIPYLPRNYVVNGQMLDPHLSGEKILEAFPDTKDYTWFTVERHPYTKMISAYYYLKNSIANNPRAQAQFQQFHNNFDVFLKHGHASGGWPVDDHLWCANGKPIVDGILRFEHLAEDFAQLGKLLDLPLRLEHQLNPGNYDNYELNDIQKKRIMKLFHNSNKFTGYGQ